MDINSQDSNDEVIAYQLPYGDVVCSKCGEDFTPLTIERWNESQKGSDTCPYCGRRVEDIYGEGFVAHELVTGDIVCIDCSESSRPLTIEDLENLKGITCVNCRKEIVASKDEVKK